MSSSAITGAHEVLSVAGYGDDVIELDYPVWLGPRDGVLTADLVAFGRAAPRDMSTAAITVSGKSVDKAYAVARAVAAPYFLVADGSQVNLWVADPARPTQWRAELTRDDVRELEPWLRPDAVLKTKVGLRQLPLFNLPIDFLAAARTTSADRLAPLIGDALRAADESVPSLDARGDAESARVRHRVAARLVVGALTVLVMRDRADDRSRRLLSTETLLHRTLAEHPDSFRWWADASSRERVVLAELVDRLGNGIDYRSLDPAILSEVYEEALVDEDDRRHLGIYYTPPHLARRLVTDLPVETVAPHDRHVLDPCCGSGTLLVAAHDRLRSLQPAGLTEADRHRELAVHLHGYEKDAFATEIARLTLLLHAQPAGNGWHIERVDTLRQAPPAPAPKLIVTNPPWRFEADGQRVQAADAFVRWSMDALAPGGLLGVLLPASWLSARNSANTRTELTTEFDVFETWRMPEGTFATSGVAAAVLLARKNDGLTGRGARAVREVTRQGLSHFLSGESPGDAFWLADADDALAQTAPLAPVHTSVEPLDAIADIRSGPQPRTDITNRGHGTPFLNHFREVPPYGLVPDEALWHVAFPDDFQSSRGASIIEKKKVLASAARSGNNPWRFRVAVDHRGIAMRNSMRGVAPHDQDDDNLLYALGVIIGSGFASNFAANYGGDRNITADVLRRLPVPTNREVIDALGALGRRAVQLASDQRALSRHLAEAEQVVWEAYGVSLDDRSAAIGRLSGHRAPEGLPRYPRKVARGSAIASTYRRVGAVLDVAGNDVLVWVNGLTPDAGVWMPVPTGMPGWLARAGATFDVRGVDTLDDLNDGHFRFQPMAWRDLDLESPDPQPLLPT